MRTRCKKILYATFVPQHNFLWKQVKYCMCVKKISTKSNAQIKTDQRREHLCVQAIPILNNLHVSLKPEGSGFVLCPHQCTLFQYFVPLQFPI